jgi:hypothetical protein
MARKIIFTCSERPSLLPLGYQFCGASALIERELLTGETSQQALDKAKNVGLMVLGWNVKALTS